MATKEERAKIWDHLNNAEEKKVKEITSKMTTAQHKKLVFNYVRSALFTDAHDLFDGRLEMLGCHFDEEEQTITTFDKVKYKIVFERIEE